MGQDINEMMQEAPVLTLDPFGETKEEVVEVKEEQVEELDVLTPKKKDGSGFCGEDRSEKLQRNSSVWSGGPEEDC